MTRKTLLHELQRRKDIDSIQNFKGGFRDIANFDVKEDMRQREEAHKETDSSDKLR